MFGVCFRFGFKNHRDKKSLCRHLPWENREIDLAVKLSY